MEQTLFSALFSFASVVLALLTFAYLLRAILGPSFFDRILAVNNISTLVILLISILSVIQKESYIIDIALIYAMLGFITTVIVSKAYLRTHTKDRYHDFDNLEGKTGGEND